MVLLSGFHAVLCAKCWGIHHVPADAVLSHARINVNHQNIFRAPTALNDPKGIMNCRYQILAHSVIHIRVSMQFF